MQILRTLIDLISSAYGLGVAAFASLVGNLILWEKLRGQRLQNNNLDLERQKLELEIQALSAQVSERQLRQLALDLTGKELPDTPEPSTAFRIALRAWAHEVSSEDAKRQVENLKEQLGAAEAQLAEFQCPFCGAGAVEIGQFPLDSEGKDYGNFEVFECGYINHNGETTQFCPLDPRLPPWESLDIIVTELEKGGWIARPQGRVAEQLGLSRGGYGTSREEAVAELRSQYDRRKSSRGKDLQALETPQR